MEYLLKFDATIQVTSRGSKSVFSKESGGMGSSASKNLGQLDNKSKLKEKTRQGRSGTNNATYAVECRGEFLYSSSHRDIDRYIYVCVFKVDV